MKVFGDELIEFGQYGMCALLLLKKGVCALLEAGELVAHFYTSNNRTANL